MTPTGSPGSSRTSTSGPSSSTSRAAPPRARATTRREWCGRCGTSSPPCPNLPLRAGVNRGHVFTGDIGNPHRRTYAVMGDAVNLAARLTARAKPGGILATADVLDRARTIYATETEPLLVKGKEQAVMAHAIGDADRPAADTAARPDADRRTRGRDRAAPAGRQPSTHAPAAGRRARGRARYRQVAPRAGAADARARLPAARRSRRAVLLDRAVQRGADAAPPARRHHARPQRGRGRDDAAAVRDRDDARPRAVASAARDPVRRRGRRDTRDVGARSRGEPGQAPLGRRDLPRADPDDADPPRDRGRSLARRCVAIPARPSRPAAGDAPVARVRDDASGRRSDRAAGRPQHSARSRAARRSGGRGARDRRRVAVRAFDRSGRRARGALGRQPALRPRARVRRSARCFAGRAPGDRREPA